MSINVFEYICETLLGKPSQAESSWEVNGGSMEPPWVLHVEDDAFFSDALKTRLELHGVAVIRAFDGMDGVRNAFKHPADAIILDVEMPNGSGDEVLRLLKENEATSHIPVVVLTCRRDRVFKQKMLDLGAAAYLNKPLEFSELHKELARHIDILSKSVNRLNSEGVLA